MLALVSCGLAENLSVSVVQSVAESEMPMVLPRTRLRESMLEVTPSLSLGTEPKMALLLGDWKMPRPMPMGMTRRR